MFESASAVGNVGLSTGATTSHTPSFVKVTTIGIMWAGRMEFVAVLGLAGPVWAGFRGR
ncbi:MAG: potassium transporter TrkG [Bacillota bacterium]